jgi:hypothetical protein
MVALDDYRAIRRTEDSFITAPGHGADEAALEERTQGYDVRRAARSREDADGSRRSA